MTWIIHTTRTLAAGTPVIIIKVNDNMILVRTAANTFHWVNKNAIL